MVVLAALIIFAVVGGIFVNYLRRNQNDIGGGMGKDYMKEHWGSEKSNNTAARIGTINFFALTFLMIPPLCHFLYFGFISLFLSTTI